MVMAFFKGGSGDGGVRDIATKAVAMLADARHSFDLATLAVLTDADPESVARDIRETDERINLTEQTLRSELIVHVSVQGNADIGSVLGLTLVLKKIERVGDQAKNILDLAENGVSFAGSEHIEQMLAEREVISGLFAEAGELLASPAADDDAIEELSARTIELATMYQDRIAAYLTSERPGREVVPLAIYDRYLRRIVANLVGVVRASIDPLPQLDYLEGGTVDTDD